MLFVVLCFHDSEKSNSIKLVELELLIFTIPFFGIIDSCRFLLFTILINQGPLNELKLLIFVVLCFHDSEKSNSIKLVELELSIFVVSPFTIPTN